MSKVGGQEHSLCGRCSLQASLHPPFCFLQLEDGFCLGELELRAHANDCANSYQMFSSMNYGQQPLQL